MELLFAVILMIAYLYIIVEKYSLNLTRLWENNQLTIESCDKYDLIVNITYLSDVNEGFALIFKDNETLDMYQKDYENKLETYNNKGIVVTFDGAYNTGKTWVLNTLTNSNFPSDIKFVTKGISITKYQGVFYLDLAGSYRVESNDKIEDKAVTDYFIQELGIQMSNVVIYLTDALKFYEVRYILNLANRFHDIKDKIKKFILVHNLKHYDNVDRVYEYINSDIIKGFGAEKNQRGRNCLYYSKNIAHVVLAKEGSKAGKEFNQCSIEEILTIIQASSDSSEPQKFLNDLTSTMSTMLPTYFEHPDMIGTSVVPYQFSPVPFIEKTNSNIDFVGSVVRNVKSFTLKGFFFVQNLMSTKQKPSNNNANALADKSRSKCAIYNNLNPDKFNTIVDFNNKIIKLEHNIKLKYFPIKDLHVPLPIVSFTPKLDIYSNDKHWIIAADILDSDYSISCENIKVILQGCRTFDDELLTKYPNITRENSDSINIRTYSIFRYEIIKPMNVFCDDEVVTYNNKGSLTIVYSKSKIEQEASH